jgi:hypothetical protein
VSEPRIHPGLPLLFVYTADAAEPLIADVARHVGDCALCQMAVAKIRAEWTVVEVKDDE